MRIASGVTDQYIYFVAVDATDFTTRETGLATWTVYRSRNTTTATVMTTPSISEVDATNMPGVYALLLDEDMTIDAGDETQEMAFHITHAGMAPVTRTIELYRPKITAGNTLGVASDGDISGNLDGTVATVTTLTGHTAQTGDSFARLGAPAGASVSADIAAVEAQTDDIGVAGAGLTAVPWNAAWDAEVQSEVTDALNAYDPPTKAELDSGLAALNDPTAATVAAAVWDEDATGHQTGGTFGQAIGDPGANTETMYDAVVTDAAGTNVAADVIAVKAETALIVADTNELQTDDVPGLIAALDAVVDTVKAETALIVADTNELQTDDVPGLIAALDAVVDTVKAETALIVADTNELQTDDVPGLIAALDAVVDTVKAETALIVADTGTDGVVIAAAQTVATVTDVTNEVTADMTKISGSATAADNLEASALGIVSSTVNDASASTTAFVSALTEATDDHYNGRIIVFTSGDVAGQATDITDYAGGTKTITMTALTEAPANGVSFVIV